MRTHRADMVQLEKARAEKLLNAVTALYDRNRQQGHAAWCGRDYDFVCPSMGTYPFQWFWDSCFHAIVLSRFDLPRAESEVAGLLANQQDDGFIGHVTFWQREAFEALLATYSIAYRTPYLSDCIQPPLIAEAVAAVVQHGASKEFVDYALPRLEKYYDFLARVRDPDGDGLIATLQPDESGLDHTPKYDAYLNVAKVDDAEFTAAWHRVTAPYSAVSREHSKMFEANVFVVEDVLVNTIYAENQRVLAEMLRDAGKQPQSDKFFERSARTTQALIQKCYEPRAGVFFDLAGNEERKLEVNTVSSIMPILLPGLRDDIVESLADQILDVDKYAAPFPVPTVARDEPTFVAGRCGDKMVWRGPSWINTNWYVARGFRRHGRPDIASHIEERSIALTEQSGFREYYNPLTGEGHGAHDFSWSALVIDMQTTL